MYANPIARAILSSSGAIPVKRNPNSGATPPPTVLSSSEAPHSSSSKDATTKANSPEVSSRSALFQETSKALASNRVVGVFPEGTSYTQSSIVQVMPGAAWAAVEYTRYACGLQSRNGNDKKKDADTGLKIVPVAIVYTDKSQYLSRICVKYGEPIVIDSYATELFEGDSDTASKSVVNQIMTTLEKQLKDMTINAPDWDTLCAAIMARNILWGDDQNIPLQDWVEVSQSLVEIFASPPDEVPSETIMDLKAALTKYYALLHYTGIKHSILTSLLPIQGSSGSSHLRSSLLVQPTLSILSSLPLSLIWLISDMLPLLFHLPGYITGYFAAKLFAVPGEEESHAQFKAIGGGLGIGVNLAMILGILWKTDWLGRLYSFVLPDEGRLPLLKGIVVLAGAIYWGVVVVVKWHKLLVKANYRELQRLLTYGKLLSVFVYNDDASLSAAELAVYVMPPLPAANAFIKKSLKGPDTAGRPQVPKVVSCRKLIRELLKARTDACNALSAHLNIK